MHPRENHPRKLTLFFAGLTILWIGASTVRAGMVTLSAYSSDSTLPEDLSATVDFSVVDTTLTILVTNLTDGPGDTLDTGFDIMALYFNATENITGLALTGPAAGWTLYSASKETKVGRFGQFDYALISGVGNDPSQIDGESWREFTLTVDGSGAAALDFHSDLSTIPTGNTPVVLAAKFVNGPGDDSAFGAVPEPATIAILALGALVFITRKK